VGFKLILLSQTMGREDSYHAIQAAERAPTLESKIKKVCVVFTLLVVAVISTYFITRNHFQTPSADPSKPYSIPDMYTARVEFQIPYINLTQPATFTVDKTSGSMKVEFYNGMDTYIYSPAASYSIVPVVTTLTCMRSEPSPLQDVFPDLALFKKQELTETITTQDGTQKKCNVWVYDYHNVTTTPSPFGSSTADVTDSNGAGYVGSYKFYVDFTTQQPVRFWMKGHNVWMGGSHFDEYIISYNSVDTLQKVDPAIFSPPAGMSCIDSDNPYGPTSGGIDTHTRRYHPLAGLHAVFPEGFRKREQMFGDFEEQYGKQYAHIGEREERKANYHATLRYISHANRRGLSYHLRVNHMADWTHTERMALRGTFPAKTVSVNDVCQQRPPTNRSATATPHSKHSAAAAAAAGAGGGGVGVGAAAAASPLLPSSLLSPPPNSVDWRPKSQGGPQPEPGFVLPAKDQGACGSCWTFGVTGTIEGQLQKLTNSSRMVALSQDNVLDCSWSYGNNGCDGGNDFNAFSWMLNENNGSIATEESYGGYMNQDGFCRFWQARNLTHNPITNSTVKAGASISSCWKVGKYWDGKTKVDAEQASSDLREALANVGPLSVSINAGPLDFYFYGGGVYYNKECTGSVADLDHTVLAVAYQPNPFANGTYTTVIRNSWSSYWGENGYATLAQQDNMCGVATTPTYVLI